MKKILIWMICISFGIILSLFIIYRMPISSPNNFTAEIKYQMIDIGQDVSPSRSLFEKLYGNKRLLLTDNTFIFVSKDDFIKCHPESPFEMRKKNYTLEIDYFASKLLTGGMSPAKILDIRKINKEPVISK